MQFKKNVFIIILLPMIIALFAASYIRFMVLHDYMIEYHIECNPQISSCFISCDNDDCSEKSYYAKIKKYAPNIFAQCGKDITNCDNAKVCLPENDNNCSTLFCNTTISNEECSILITQKSEKQS